MNSQYYQKYLKYKTKYCHLSNSIKGGASYINDLSENVYRHSDFSGNLKEFLKQDLSNNPISSYAQYVDAVKLNHKDDLVAIDDKALLDEIFKSMVFVVSRKMLIAMDVDEFLRDKTSRSYQNKIKLEYNNGTFTISELEPVGFPKEEIIPKSYMKGLEPISYLQGALRNYVVN